MEAINLRMCLPEGMSITKKPKASDAYDSLNRDISAIGGPKCREAKGEISVYRAKVVNEGMHFEASRLVIDEKGK